MIFFYLHGHKNWFTVLVFWFQKQQQSFAIYNLSQVYVQSLEIRSFDPPITRILVVCIENTHFADFSRISFWRKDELRYQNFLKNIYISATVNTHKTKLFSSFHGCHSGAFSMEKKLFGKSQNYGDLLIWSKGKTILNYL